MKKALSISMLCALSLIASQVGADVIATRTRTAAFTVLANTIVNPPLNNANSVTMPFVTTRDNQRVVITYNAECSVKSLSQSAYMNITIFVDNVAAAPSSVPNAFCTSDGNATLLGEWARAVTQVVFVVEEPGVHAVALRAELVNEIAGNFGTLSASSIVVEQ